MLAPNLFATLRVASRAALPQTSLISRSIIVLVSAAWGAYISAQEYPMMYPVNAILTAAVAVIAPNALFGATGAAAVFDAIAWVSVGLQLAPHVSDSNFIWDASRVLMFGHAISMVLLYVESMILPIYPRVIATFLVTVAHLLVCGVLFLPLAMASGAPGGGPIVSVVVLMLTHATTRHFVFLMCNLVPHADSIFGHVARMAHDAFYMNINLFRFLFVQPHD